MNKIYLLITLLSLASCQKKQEQKGTENKQEPIVFAFVGVFSNKSDGSLLDKTSTKARTILMSK